MIVIRYDQQRLYPCATTRAWRRNRMHQSRLLCVSEPTDHLVDHSSKDGQSSSIATAVNQRYDGTFGVPESDVCIAWFGRNAFSHLDESGEEDYMTCELKTTIRPRATQHDTWITKTRLLRPNYWVCLVCGGDLVVPSKGGYNIVGPS